MPLDTYTVTRPAQKNQAGAIDALVVEEFQSDVEHTITRKSVTEPWLPTITLNGTNLHSKFGVGETTLGAVTPGTIPDGQAGPDFSKNTLKVDTLVYARNTIPLLDSFITSYDARREIAIEHGKKISKFKDNAFLTIAAKAALATLSPYSGGTAGKPAGYSGGNVQTLTAAGDANDPAKIYAAIADLFVKFENKDVDPRMEDMILAFRPAQFYALAQAEQIVNGEYVTADGTKMDNVMLYKAFGVPVISTNNLPSGVVSGHLLSNAGNGNAYDGDFSKLVALAFAPRALMAGQIIPLQSDVFYDKISKLWFVDSHLSFGATPDRTEYAGGIFLP